MHVVHRILVLLAAIAGIGLGYSVIARPWYRSWGATADEVTKALPGDRILTAPCQQETRAIAIAAPADQVWPWLAQLGQDRAGFYSYRVLENLVGAEMPAGDRLLPEKQSWRPGDKLWMAPPERFGGVGHADLIEHEPGRALAFATWVVPPRPGERKAPEGSWSFIVEPAGPAASRLLIRGRTVTATTVANRVFQRLAFEPLHFAMERKMMMGLRDRAQGRGPTPAGDDLEVTCWTLLFACALGSAVLVVGRRRVTRPLIALLGAALGFGALTLLQPGPAPSVVASILVVLLVPWRAPRTARPSEAFERFLPVHEFAGQVSVRTDAEPRDLLAAFHEVALDEMPLAALLGWLRYLPGRLLGKAAPSPRPQPFLDQLIEGGNVILSASDHEELIGSIGKFHQVSNQELVKLRSAGEFCAFDDPRYQKLAISVRVQGEPGARRLTLEHRTHALSPRARRRFAIYWLAIGPLGNLVSWLLLRAVRRRAEHPGRAAVPGSAHR